MKTTMRKKTIIRNGLPNLRDLINSGYYAVVIPVLVKIQELIEIDGFSFSWRDIAAIALSALLSHIIRKSLSKPAKIEVTELSADGGDGPQNPPPFGDPTHPKP